MPSLNGFQRGSIYLGKGKSITPASVYFLLMNSKPDPENNVWILGVVPGVSSCFVPGCDQRKNFYRFRPDISIYPGIRYDVLTYGLASIPGSIFKNNVAEKPVITLSRQLVDDIAACVVTHGHILEGNKPYLW